MKRFFFNRRFIVLLICLPLLIFFCLFGYLWYSVSRDAAVRIQRGAIDEIISSESPVFYDDGCTTIGVFFESTHRKHIPYEEIPRIFIKALIAAEDRNFFHHIGFDLKAMLRALMVNIKAGEVVQGGSTLTQQAAKNIFRRERRSYKAKVKELIQAFLLERRYTKEEIIELYVNQFFVTGYGKGLRIAAQYFFGKDAKDLSLVEAAYIAGSLKGPNRYNPFIKKTQPAKEDTRQSAKARKDYVLDSMFKMHFITEDEYSDGLNQEVPFKEGKITYRLNVILDYIREQLESEYFKGILDEQGLENIATSGISIYTSINKEIQEATLRSLRRNLSLIDIQLNGFNVGQVLDMYDRLPGQALKESGGLPFMARITHIETDKPNCHLGVEWDNGRGVIDYEGIEPVGEAWIKWKKGRRAVFDKKSIPLFLKNFHVGDPVPVQLIPTVKKSSDDRGEIRLRLSSIPELEGGAVVLQKGMIKAMAGGFFDCFFNRAVDAKRQLGSIFKPIVYTAALQLKWNVLDPLENRRDIFRFEKTVYSPRPDHRPESESVSMLWAGAKSENLATVWLLYHLTDHLNMSEFRQIAETVGLARKRRETYQAYKERIRDQYGVVVNNDALMEAAFEEAKKQIESDIIFEGYGGMLGALNRLHFKTLDTKNVDLEVPETRQLLRQSFQRLSALNLRAKEQFQSVVRVLEQYARHETPELRERLAALLANFYRTYEEGRGEEIVYVEDIGNLDPSTFVSVEPEWLQQKSSLPTIGEVNIDGLIPAKVIDMLQKNTLEIYGELLSNKRYDLQVLSKIRDFRTLVNLFYVVYLSKQMGISTGLDPVLSFPLGPNSISIMEAALAYQTIMTGRVYPLSNENRLRMVPVITKITDREGEIIYEYEARPEQVLSDRVSGLITQILEKVMETGTGRKAKDSVRIFDIPIPVFGKTGTANRFTNSSFVGFIPGPGEDAGQLDIREGYVIAGYVGYDDNRPMKSEHMAIYGASGALPIWVDTSNTIVNSDDYKKNFQIADLAFGPIVTNFLVGTKDLRRVHVSPVTGLIEISSGEGPDSSPLPQVFAEIDDPGDTLDLKRHFEPVSGEEVR